MSIMPDPPTGISHAHGGLADSGLVGSLRAGYANYENALLQPVTFDKHFFDFGEVGIPGHQLGANGLFTYEESDAANEDFVKVTPTATKQSHIMGDIKTDDSQISLVTLPMFLSGQNPWVEVAFDLESITELIIQIGFSDPAAAAAALLVTDVDDVPTVNAAVTDCALACISTDDTIQTLRLITKDGTTVTGVTGSPTAAPHGIPTIATQVVYRVELRGQTVYCFVNGTLVATSAATAGPRTSVLLECVIMFGNLHTDDKEVRIDYIDVGQERLSQPF